MAFELRHHTTPMNSKKRLHTETRLDLKDRIDVIDDHLVLLQFQIDELKRKFAVKAAEKAELLDRYRNGDYVPERTEMAEKWPFMDRLARALARGGGSNVPTDEDSQGEVVFWLKYRNDSGAYPLSQMVAAYSKYKFRLTEVTHDPNYERKNYTLKAGASCWLHSGLNHEPIAEVIIVPQRHPVAYMPLKGG
jgi:hypothetical protein